MLGKLAQLKKATTDDALEKEKNERMKVRFLSCDPGVRYSSNFRQKNNNEVRNLTVKHATHVQTLAWQTALRPDNPKKDL